MPVKRIPIRNMREDFSYLEEFAISLWIVIKSCFGNSINNFTSVPFSISLEVLTRTPSPPSLISSIVMPTLTLVQRWVYIDYKCNEN